MFSDLFQDKKYLLQLYQALHPEDAETTEDDLVDVTIQKVLTDGLYNDLGFRNRNRVVILTEAQSAWSVNIIVRAILYLAQTWHEYIETTKQDRYGSKKLELPKAEMYVIFTGSRQKRPEYINLADEFFGGDRKFLDARVKMLYGDGDGDIISQYVDFTRIYKEQAKLHGRTRETILEVIWICKEKGVLREYLSNREKEVVSIMMALFDQEKIVERYQEQFEYEKKQEGRREGRKEGRQNYFSETAGIQEVTFPDCKDAAAVIKKPLGMILHSSVRAGDLKVPTHAGEILRQTVCVKTQRMVTEDMWGEYGHLLMKQQTK